MKAASKRPPPRRRGPREVDHRLADGGSAQRPAGKGRRERSPIIRKRAFSRQPATIAAAASPPAARTAVAANWADPAKTRADIAMAAPAPIVGRATTPKDTATQEGRHGVGEADAEARPEGGLRSEACSCATGARAIERGSIGLRRGREALLDRHLASLPGREADARAQGHRARDREHPARVATVPAAAARLSRDHGARP